MTSIRAASERDAGRLPEVEKSASVIFRQWKGLEWIADDDVQSEGEHGALIAQGIALVAEDRKHGIVAFLNGEFARDELHIWQIAVRHERQGCGIGRRLMEAARLLAIERGARALTLTTFRDVPWNEPYYRRLGFRVLADDAMPARLRTILDKEGQAGLPLEQRCAMLMEL